MRKGFLERAQNLASPCCPTCGYEFLATMANGEFVQAEPNSLVVCVKCAQVGQYVDSLHVRTFDIAQLTPKDRATMKRIQREVKSRWKEEPN